jgi:hypothetical protein
MNKRLNLLVMLACLLALSFVLFSCLTTGSSNLGTPPVLTDFITLTRDNGVNKQWIQNNSFETNARINVGVKGYDLESNVRKLVLSAKRGGSDAGKWELKISGKGFTQYWGSFRFSSGDYTFEIYAVDAKGNQSNTLSTAFTVRDL